MRSFLVQGSWNYRTLIGGGIAYALIPVLRALHGNDRERLEATIARHMELFNSHPYLATLALGAITSLEEEGESEVMIERFKTALRSALGALGDNLVWVGWRPVCLLATIVVLLAGAPWWLGVAGFLLVYNAGHIALRAWGFEVGLRQPRRIGQTLRHGALQRLREWFMTAGIFLIGLGLPLAVAGGPVADRMGSLSRGSDIMWWVAASAAAIIGIWLGRRARNVAAIALAGIMVVGIIIGLIR